MLNKKMNEAMSIISAMPFEEKMLYMSICFEEAVMDKDMEDEVPCVVIYNSGVQKSKNFSYKHIRKDKSKAGYHNGARHSGFGSYDKWGKPEKLAKDQHKDLKAQMMELEKLSDNITIDTAVDMLYNIYRNYYFGGFSMDLMWYHKSDWYDNLQENFSMVENIYQEYMEKLEEIQMDLYNSAETLFPEMGMGFQNEVVKTFNRGIKDDLFFTKSRMVHWLVSRYKDNREYEKWSEELRHNAEMDRLNKLMEEAEKYIK